jgi:hypothetical protein
MVLTKVSEHGCGVHIDRTARIDKNYNDSFPRKRFGRIHADFFFQSANSRF